jgi:Pentapeptide repeats (8 copies)
MVWRITPDELLERYQAGERNFNGIELIPVPERVDGTERVYGLEGNDLTGISLRGASLINTDLTGTNLNDADLFGACLYWSWLDYAILRNANLSNANLRETVLHYTDFSGVRFRHANLTRVDFRSCIFGDGDRGGNGVDYATLVSTSFKGVNIGNRHICSGSNYIYRVALSDGTVVEGPQIGWKFTGLTEKRRWHFTSTSSRDRFNQKIKNITLLQIKGRYDSEQARHKLAASKRI